MIAHFCLSFGILTSAPLFTTLPSPPSNKTAISFISWVLPLPFEKTKRICHVTLFYAKCERKITPYLLRPQAPPFLFAHNLNTEKCYNNFSAYPYYYICMRVCSDHIKNISDAIFWPFHFISCYTSTTLLPSTPVVYALLF